MRNGICGDIFEKASFPSFEEGRLRRTTNATLPQEIGAAGEVRRTLVAYRLPDRFKNSLDVLMNGSILESKKFYSQSLQKRRTFPLVLCSELLEMRRTVQFDANIALDAEKVDNIATYAGLPAELLSQHLPSLKVLP